MQIYKHLLKAAEHRIINTFSFCFLCKTLGTLTSKSYLSLWVETLYINSITIILTSQGNIIHFNIDHEQFCLSTHAFPSWILILPIVVELPSEISFQILQYEL